VEEKMMHSNRMIRDQAIAGLEPVNTGTSAMQVDRRRFMQAGALAAASLLWPLRGSAAESEDPLAAAIAKSQLVYISPLRSSGAESACHGEVWFVADGKDVLVVTNPERWRAAAIASGLDQARLWVGDHGVWTRSAGRFKASPTFVAHATLEPDSRTHALALESFGQKYSAGWEKWGPRFESGLASGERVLIRYAPTSGCRRASGSTRRETAPRSRRTQI
jgi:hypothetical protein